MAIDKSLQTGSTAMLVLKLLENEDMYGYQMIERLASQSNNVFALKAGTLYLLLKTLEDKGFLNCYEQASDSLRIRKYYFLTKAGKDCLQEKTAEWELFSGTINQIMQGVPKLCLHSKEDFLVEICKNVRWAKSHTVIKKELADHIDDQTTAFVADGINLADAEQKAIAEMGSVDEIGISLDKVYKPKANVFMFLIVFGMLFGGLALRIVAFRTIYILDIVAVFVGVAALLFAYFLDYTFVYKYSHIIYAVICVMFILSFLKGDMINGRIIWLTRPEFALEYLLVFFPLCYACILHKMPKGGIREIVGMAGFAGWLGLRHFLFCLQFLYQILVWQCL